MATVLRLPACLTVREARATTQSLSAQLAAAAPGAAVELDASALQQFDSSALALLIELHRCAARQGRRLQVRGLPVRLRELAGLYGVAELVAQGVA
ncbi:STAS domain-containing protein [Sphaerotilus sp.]|jgi:phospholipid transport system transporter-binding protein|uniref:STAS domain-containing protein n=1 Tax=Sphaerotilus sp. TaxID=2093942 RepID=UPI0025FC81A0|nr:STAS domain-containing protein [Sphaerotilus sp.]